MFNRYLHNLARNSGLFSTYVFVYFEELIVSRIIDLSILRVTNFG